MKIFQCRGAVELVAGIGLTLLIACLYCLRSMTTMLVAIVGQLR